MAVPLVAVVLAAGESTRMNSKIPKVLLPVAGQPMMDYALQNAEALKPAKILVALDSPSREVVSYLGKRARPVLLSKKLGTGQAMLRVLSYLKGFKGNLLVMYAEDCLTRTPSVLALRQFHSLQNSAATFLTAQLKFPFRYARIIRDPAGEVERIVGEEEADEEERKITEVNAGVYCFQAPALDQALRSLRAAAGKKAFYLTQTVPFLRAQGGKVQALMAPDVKEVFGINRSEQLTWAHRILNLRRVKEHQGKGVLFLDAKTVDIDPRVVIGGGTVIESHVHILGRSVIGENCRVESGSRLEDAHLGRGVTVKSSRIIQSRLGDGCDAGPYAHIRGGCVLEKDVHVGTNAELKGSHVGSGSKVGHFSYVGDGQLGREVNVGAGCVFANFDGKKKHASRVGDKAFLGSNSTLVAPVKIGAKAVVGAGAVVTKDVPAAATVVGVPAKPLKKEGFNHQGTKGTKKTKKRS